MELLKTLALTGKLVFVIIHQPSPEIFRMFDRLLVMDLEGHTIYYGNPLEAVPYFRKEAGLPPVQNPAEVANSAEIFDIVETKLVSEMGVVIETRKFTPSDWAGRYSKNFVQQKIEAVTEEVPHVINKPGFFQQIKLFFHRDVLAKIHDKQYLLINLLEAPVLALLLALVVRYAPTEDFFDKPYRFSANENIPAYFFMSVIVALFMGLSVSAEEIIRDRLLLKREKFLHLNRDSYLIAKILLMFCLSAIHTLAFVGISDYVLEVNEIGIEFWMVLFSVSCCANLLGLVLSDTFKNAVVVYILIPLLLIPQLVLGGVVIRYDRLNPLFAQPGKVPPIGETMVSRWAYEALMVAQFKNNDFQKIVFESEARKEEYHYKRSYYLKELQTILEELQNSPSDTTSAKYVDVKKNLLYSELSKEEKSLGEKPTDWSYLKGPNPYPKELFSKTEDRIKDFISIYNQRYLVEEARLNKIYKEKDNPSIPGNQLAEMRLSVENEQINQMVAGTEMFSQKKLEISKNGIFRKTKPIYQYPEPQSMADFRAHFYSPVKHFLGMYFPTELFNIFIIWMFSLGAIVFLKFRLLRKLFMIPF
jgi:hypothetical protein